MARDKFTDCTFGSPTSRPASAIFLCLLGAVTAACSSQWTTPAGTPDDVAQLCRETAEEATGNRILDTPADRAIQMPGSADDMVEDARRGREDQAGMRPSGQVIFYQCLEENGVTLEPAQRDAVDRWLESQASGSR